MKWYRETNGKIETGKPPSQDLFHLTDPLNP